MSTGEPWTTRQAIDAYTLLRTDYYALAEAFAAVSRSETALRERNEILRQICKHLVRRLGPVRRLRSRLQRGLVIWLITHPGPHTLEELVAAAIGERMTEATNVWRAVQTSLGCGDGTAFRILEDGRVIVHPAIFPTLALRPVDGAIGLAMGLILAPDQHAGSARNSR